MRAMYFNDGEFHSNLCESPAGTLCVNMTVRQGIEWATKVKVGDDLALRETETDVLLGLAKVFDVKVLPFNALSVPAYAKVVGCHHLERGQTYTGLFKAMKECYDGFLSAEIVTLVFFTITQQNIDGKRAETETE